MVAEAEFEANINYEPSEVQKFYKGSRIFITGGSGFLGQLLIQKLIRDCPDIDKIFLLLRAKKGKTPEQRYEEMFQDPIFERMKLEQPNYKEKIILLIGDIEQPDLGLSEDDRKLIREQVNIIFHVAATVRLDEKIKKATAINVRATKDIISLAKTITNFKILIYVSTAYSNCLHLEIGEQFYDVHITPDRLMQITDVLNDDELAVLTPKLISKWPNTYSFTKAIAENVVREYGKDFPIAIVRPSMVISTVDDPVKSWINNIYGPVGVAVAISLGLLHTYHTLPNGTTDMVPADYVVNSIIVAASQTGSRFNNISTKTQESNIILDELATSNEAEIFNYTSYSENPITWSEFYSLAEKGKDWQSVHTIWYCFAVLTPNYYFYVICNILFHLIPAYIADLISCACGKEPRLMKAYRKIKTMHDMVRYFSTKVWKFENYNTQALWKNLNSTDRRLFPFSMKELVWKDYFQNFGRGLRLYLLNDPLETLPEALAKHQKLKIAHYSVTTIFSLLILTVLYKIFLLFL